MLKQSEDISKLAAALAKVQSALKPVTKDADNPFFKSKYATLEAVIEASTELLAANGLSVIQMPDFIEGAWSETVKTDRKVDRNGEERSPAQVVTKTGTQTPVLITMILHESGQFISGSMLLMMAKFDPQGQGSAISYARRYARAGALGLVQADDDGNAATNRGNQDSNQGNNQRSAYSKGQGGNVSAPNKSTANKAADLTFGKVMSNAVAAGWSIDGAKKYMSEFFQMNVGDLTKLSAQELMKGQEKLLADSPKNKEVEEKKP